MAHYLVQLSYTSDAWAAMLQHPQNRMEMVRGTLEKLGARFEAAYFAFGDDDAIFILEAPDNLTAATLAMVFTSGGAIRRYKTTPLMTMDEGTEAMRKGGEARGTYQPPQ